MKRDMFDVVTIGTGPAGYAAAIYLTRYKVPNVLVGAEAGGLMMYADIVENYPGFPSIQGPELMKQFKEQATRVGVDLRVARVTGVEKKDTGEDSAPEFIVHLEDDEASGPENPPSSLRARALIFATGTVRRKLGVPGEAENVGMGVSYCATCDAPFFKNRVCCVVGGSDSAAKEALVLSRVAKKVHVIYRKSRLRAEPLMAERVYNTENIEVIHDANVKEICTNEHGIVDKVVLEDGSIIETNGVFIEIGFDPRSDLARSIGVEVNEKGEIIVDREGRTNVPGVFAAGDVTDVPLKQAITAAGDGAKAAWAAYKYLGF